MSARLPTAETVYRGERFGRGAPALRAAVFSGVPVVREDLAPGAEIAARVDHGRWIVDCPWCSSAQMAAETDRRFLCVECGNLAVEGRLVRVVWPKDPAAVEAPLLVRPTENRNWSPGETVGALRAENVAHGLGDR